MRLIFKFIQYSDHSFPEHMDGLVWYKGGSHYCCTRSSKKEMISCTYLSECNWYFT